MQQLYPNLWVAVNLDSTLIMEPEEGRRTFTLMIVSTWVRTTNEATLIFYGALKYCWASLDFIGV
jgi:hypothetical protein